MAAPKGGARSTDNAEVASSILASPTKDQVGGHFHDWASSRDRSIHSALNRVLVRPGLRAVGVRPGQRPVGAAASGPGSAPAVSSYGDGRPRGSRQGQAMKGEAAHRRPMPIAGSAPTGGPPWAIGGRRYERLAAALMRSSLWSRVRRFGSRGPPGGDGARPVVICTRHPGGRLRTEGCR